MILVFFLHRMIYRDVCLGTCVGTDSFRPSYLAPLLGTPDGGVVVISQIGVGPAAAVFNTQPMQVVFAGMTSRGRGSPRSSTTDGLWNNRGKLYIAYFVRKVPGWVELGSKLCIARPFPKKKKKKHSTIVLVNCSASGVG